MNLHANEVCKVITLLVNQSSNCAYLIHGSNNYCIIILYLYIGMYMLG